MALHFHPHHFVNLGGNMEYGPKLQFALTIVLIWFCNVFVTLK